MQQDRLIGAAGDGRYAAHRGWAGRPENGNSLLVREPLAATAGAITESSCPALCRASTFSADVT